MNFSQRNGLLEIRSCLQVGSMNSSLKNRLWNTLFEDYIQRIRTDRVAKEIAKFLWKEFFKLPVDVIPLRGYSYLTFFNGYLRDWFFEAKWNQIYDLIEFLADFDSKITRFDIAKKINIALKTELAGYRIIENTIFQITSEEEIVSLEEAFDLNEKYQTVNIHLKASLSFLSNRENPDYRNSIKESISAVEALCRIIAEDDSATLGKALAIIERKHKLHNSLKKAFSTIYGYTSESSGIRHALLEKDAQVDFAEAKFMLVACSAFINYLKVKVNT